MSRPSPPRIPETTSNTSREAGRIGSLRPGARVGDRPVEEAVGSLSLLHLQSGFQPTREPTGFQPVERQLIVASGAGSDTDRPR